MKRWRLRFTPLDREEARERYLQFELPPGNEAIMVSLDYDRSGAVIDLGLFGPGGFRGYSGSARSEIVLGRDQATPGYLPGELEAGIWEIYLRLHRVPDEGIEARLQVEAGGFSPQPAPAPPPPPPRPPARRLPSAKGRRWLRGDVHAHTYHSDGALSVDQLAALGAASGLDFLAVTDHNTVSHHAEIAGSQARYGLLLIRGEEVTSELGHAGVIGGKGWVDWRTGTELWAEAAHQQGGLLAVNHPLGPDQVWARPLPKGVDLIELWHGDWDRLGEGATSWWRGKGAAPVGGSDFHRPERSRLGRPTTWVEAEGENVLGALAAGRVMLSFDPMGPVVLVIDDRVRVLGGEGLTLFAGDGFSAGVLEEDFSLPARPGPYLLRDPEGRLMAFTPGLSGP